jgi:phage-related protein
MTAPVLPLQLKITNQTTKTSKDRVLIAQFGNGYSQIANDGINSKVDSWQIQYAPIYGADLITLNAFLDLVGVTAWFTWIPLGEAVSKKWRIDKDSRKQTMLNINTFIFTFTITQVFDLGV